MPFKQVLVYNGFWIDQQKAVFTSIDHFSGVYSYWPVFCQPWLELMVNFGIGIFLDFGSDHLHENNLSLQVSTSPIP